MTASSNEGDVLLDPFCGCGTAIAVAQTLKRRWIGIDITHLAILHFLGEDARFCSDEFSKATERLILQWAFQAKI